MTEKKTEKNKIKDREKSENSDPRMEETNDRDESTVETVKEGDETERSESTEEFCEEEKLKGRIRELEDKLLRTSADFDNYKKRIARQYDDLIRSANDKILMELLEVVDNFERALEHDHENSDVGAFRKGMELIFNQIMDLLKKYDVKPIDALGKPFDPALHEAMMQVETTDLEEGINAVEMSRGYRQGDRVLRHSKVGVSKGKTKPENEQEVPDGSD